MKRKICSLMLACSLILSLFTVVKAEQVDFSQWEPWSFYTIEGKYNAQMPVMGDTSDPGYYVPVIPSYKSSNNVSPGLLADPGKDMAYIYIRPQYEFDVKIKEHIKDKATFDFNRENGNENELVLGFTVPSDGKYNLKINIINDCGNLKKPEKGTQDGGYCHVTILKNGMSEETSENTEILKLPESFEAVEEISYNKDDLAFIKGDKIFLRINNGGSGKDIFQAAMKVEKLGNDSEVVKTYDIRDLVDKFDGTESDGIENVIEDSVEEFDEEKALSENDDKSAKLLAALGFIDESEIGEYLLKRNMTRAEFAKLIGPVLGYSKESKTESKYFTDVKEEHCPNYIDSLVEEGIVSKDRTFRPEDDITKNEIAAIIVRALGYDEYALYYGGYPEGYLMQAAKLEIFPKGIKNNVITRNEGIKIIENILDINILNIDSVSGNNATFNNHDKETLLSSRHDIYFDEGIITKIPYATLYKDNFGIENRITIGDEEYISEIVPENMIGFDVDFYYSLNDSEKTLLYLEPDKRNRQIILDASEIEEMNDSDITYYENKKSKKYKISKNADFLYNQNACDFSGNLMQYINKDSYLFILDNDGDNNFDVIDIRTYNNYVVEEIRKKDFEIIDKLNNKKIGLDSYGETVFYDQDKNRVDFDINEPEDVISVFETNDKNIMTVYISKNRITGKVTSKKTEDGNYYYTVDDKKYKVAENYSTYADSGIETGLMTTFYLDTFSKIAYVENDYSERFGYLDRVLADVNNPEEIMFRIVTISGESVDYKVSDKVMFNEVKTESDKLLEIINYEYPDYKYQGIIQYKAVNGNLKMIKMPDKLYTTHFKKALKYSKNANMFEGKIVIDEDTMVFHIPDNKAEKPKVSSAKSFFRHYSYYSGLTSVTAEEDSIISDVLLIKGTTSEGVSGYPVLVKDIQYYLDEDDEIRPILTGYRDGKEVTYKVKSENTIKGVIGFRKSTSDGLFDIDIGDVILISLDNDTITYAEIDFDASQKKKVGPNPYTDYFGKPYLLYTGVYQRIGQYIKVSKYPDTVVDKSTLQIQKINRIYIIDLSKDKDKIVEGNYSDLVPYIEGNSESGKVNDNYTKVLISTMEKPDAIYIYR